MKVIICEKYGPPEVLKITEIPKPNPKSDELLVRIKATAVNSGDVRVRGLAVSGFMKLIMLLVLGFNKPSKSILGTVFSGVVEEVGNNVHKFKIGDEVFGMSGFQFGTYAEYICIKQDSTVCLKPINGSFEEAASIVFGGSSAYYFLKKAGIDISPKKVLIYGATGSVGIAAVQMAKYYNADITAVCSEAGFDLIKSLGIKNILNYNNDFIEQLFQTGEKFDIVFDAVGKISKRDCAKILSANSKFITVGGLDVADETLQQMEFLKKLFEEGFIKPVIDKIFSLDEIVEAHRYVDSGRKKGNVVLRINNNE
ncbi:NAD(P)-dependent alcohol dehydrogenase [Leptospira sp. GIMC2001]|uniref:NAD(P)-dependent alcohol dehydrogenase n=1 Tax=Leptospira sp. GIMC2001 TaxID=1513297 RepID=UPI00234AEBDF|nr:NAD(P)-dependent alcohol dehydrogenase [Leptospira sp. GIMC2001]WCL47604.1 NAD(P)-dependent alcohol dehydrogenase [Leptospira sp. GIMC2001]